VSRLLVAIVALLAALLSATDARAHKPSDAYLTFVVRGATVDVRWDIALRDADYAVGLDEDGDGAITWAEVLARAPALRAYAASRLEIDAGDGACALREKGPLAVADHSDGAYAVLRFEAACAREPTAMTVRYGLFFDVDAQHRGILRLDAAGDVRTYTFSSTSREVRVDVASGSGAQLRRMVREGVVHIWLGYDHILFLVALLLPAVLRRERRGWRPASAFRPALVDVLRIVTAFTVAHSITLSLAALGVVTLPSRLVESAIAASVVVAALNNVWPILEGDRWTAAFLLGLMHGFGFSATLMDMGLPRSSLLVTLFGFNAGVEIGQVAIVCVFVPVAYALRRTRFYRRAVLVGGSLAIAGLALVWFVERAVLGKMS
jgi:hypothetical protein